MTNVQENKFTMYLGVQKTVNFYKTVWQELAAYCTAFNDFEIIIALIKTDIENQEKKDSGVKDDKDLAQLAMAEKAFEVSGSIIAFAAYQNNNTLKKKVQFSMSKLTTGRDTICMQRCQLIKNEAFSILNPPLVPAPEKSPLADYGTEASTLIDLQQKIDTYSNLITAPRNAQVQQKDTTAHLISLFRKGDSILKNKLDTLMPKFKTSSTKFHEEYKNIRIIVKSGLHHNKENNTDIQPQSPNP